MTATAYTIVLKMAFKRAERVTCGNYESDETPEEEAPRRDLWQDRQTAAAGTEIGYSFEYMEITGTHQF